MKQNRIDSTLKVKAYLRFSLERDNVKDHEQYNNTKELLNHTQIHSLAIHLIIFE